MRDFNFNGDANISAANIAGARPAFDEIPPSAKVDEVLNEELSQDLSPDGSQSLRSFHVEPEDDESNNLPKILGAAVVGLLIVGGGIYAYESSSANQAPKAVAMKSVAPVHQAANIPSPAANSTPLVAAPVTRSTSPAPTLPEPVKQAAATPGVGIGPTDDAAINAPMTYTADNAPPPQQAGSSSEVAVSGPAAPSNQTALQQPISPPNIPGNSTETGSSLANNGAHGISLRPDQTPGADSQPAPAAP